MKKLREGFTTGSCAAAAALAACLWQRDGFCPDAVELEVPGGKIYRPDIVPHEDGSCGIYKDSGDDPDITNGMEIVSRVELLDGDGPVTFRAGDGVGIITQPGLKIPVVSVGSHDMRSAEAAIRDGKCDMVAMIRAFLADPQQLVKAREGRLEEIRPCIRCNVCTGDDPHGCPKPLRCTVNPPQGRQPLFDRIEPAQPGKKVVIVGGGAAGMEAARRLTERGLKPVLFEKEAELGGSLRTAGCNPLKEDVRRYGDWSVRMTLNNPDIDVRLGTEATRERVLAEKPDAVIVAVGSEPIVPPVEGVRGANVCLAQDIDKGLFKPGRRVIIVGAGLTGTETAVTLAREGHEVLVMDLLPLRAVQARDKAVGKAHRLAQAAGVQFKEEFRLKAITPTSLIGEEKTGAVTEIACDTVALSLGVRPRKAVTEALEGVCGEMYFVGDCALRQGNITTAVRDGFYAAMNV